MQQQAGKYITPEEYLELEVVAESKHEYFRGEVVALAGASEAHNRIVANLIGELYNFLSDKNCGVFPSDLRVATPMHDSYMYPDVSIICDEVEKRDGAFDTISNPSVIIEVMSPTTRERDLGYKFWYYLQIPSLKEYIMVDSAFYSIKTITKNADGSFRAIEMNGSDNALTIQSIGLQLPLEKIYRKVILNTNQCHIQQLQANNFLNAHN